MKNDFPTEGMALTNILVVSDIQKSKTFYVDVLGAKLFREYGGNSVVINFLNSWILLVTGGGPTKDKPEVVFASPADSNNISHAMTIRVPDCEEAYKVLKSRGRSF